MAGSVWFYVQRILIPYQIADAAAHGRPRRVLSDLYPRWLGTRELLLHHRDPYSPEVTRDIQIGYYGHVLNPNNPTDPKDEQRFAYPVYVVFLLAPFVHIPFPALRVGFALLLAMLTAASVRLWLKFIDWRILPATVAALTVFTLGSFAAVQGIKLQQLSLLVSAMIASAAVLLTCGQLFAAGFLLAIATIKPQLVILLVVWLLLWSVAGWRDRQNFFWGFLLGTLLLIGAGEYVLPGWISHFADAVAAYRRYTENRSPVDALTTPAVSAVLTAALVFVTLALCWRHRNSPVHSFGFQLVTAFMLLATLLLAPSNAPYNQVLLLPGILLILRSWHKLWTKGIWSRLFCVLMVTSMAWPWVSSFFLMLASIVLPSPTIQKAWAVPLWTSITLPLIVMGLLAALASEARRSGTSAAGA
jgi:hypothetical protein